MLVETAFGIIGSELLAGGFEFINLATRARLMPIKASCLQKERARELHGLVWPGRVHAEHDGGDQTFHAPVETKHPLDRLPIDKRRFRHLHDHIEYRDPAAIGFDQLTQGGCHGRSFLEASKHTGGKGHTYWLFAPLPRACLVGEAEEQRSGPGGCIEGKPVTLPFVPAIVASVGEQADLEQRNALHVFVRLRELPMCKEVVTGLLDHILHGDERRIIIFQRFLQRLDGLFDASASLARGPLLGLGTNEVIGENRLDQLKNLLALGLSAHNPINFTTCFQAGPVRSVMNASSDGHNCSKARLTTWREASSNRKASTCASSGSLIS